jgi:hypothetical protein
MSDVVARLRAAEEQARLLGRESMARLLREAADDLAALEGRIVALTESLQDLVAVGDSRRSRTIAEIRLALGKARLLLVAAPSLTQPGADHVEEIAGTVDVFARPVPTSADRPSAAV